MSTRILIPVYRLGALPQSSYPLGLWALRNTFLKFNGSAGGLVHEISGNSSRCFSFQTSPNKGNDQMKSKTNIIPKITLVSGNDLHISTLKDAQKLAKRRGLKLVKIKDLDTKTHRPVYQLMTETQYHKDDLKQGERKKTEKQKNALKGEKVLMIGQNISEHDLQTHCSKVIKWLEKNYEVRIMINGDSENLKKAEHIYTFMEDKLSNHGKIVQKRQKGSDIKFQVLPSKDNKSDNNKNKNIDSSI